MRRRRSPSPYEGLIRELVTGLINPHSDEFKKKYAVIDDLVNYVIGNPNVQVMYDNTPNFISGFTPNIGKLVAHLHRQCRANGPFMNEVRLIVDHCRDVPADRTAHTFTQDIISNYVKIIEGGGLIFYFAFFAVICELCSRFTDNMECYTEIKNVAKATLFAYWDDTLKCDELDEFARNNLHCSEEVFAEHFRSVLDFLYEFEVSDDEEDDEVLGEDDEVLGEDDEALGEDDEALGEDDEALGEDDEALGENDEALGENGVYDEQVEEGVSPKRRRMGP